MPTYNYKCQSCNTELEVVQKMSEDPLKDCPECKSEGTLEKVLTNGNFILKGGGWFKN